MLARGRAPGVWPCTSAPPSTSSHARPPSRKSQNVRSRTAIRPENGGVDAVRFHIHSNRPAQNVFVAANPHGRIADPVKETMSLSPTWSSKSRADPQGSKLFPPAGFPLHDVFDNSVRQPGRRRSGLGDEGTPEAAPEQPFREAHAGKLKH